MNANILQIIKIEELVNIYFDNRNVILKIWIIISIIASLYMLKKLKRPNGMHVLGKATLNIVIIGIVGLVINTTGLKLDFSVDYMPFLVFAAAVFITLLIKATEYIKFRKNCGTVVKSVARITGYIIECELLLLIILGRLDCIEFFSSWIGFMALKLLEEYIEKTIEDKYETISSPENNRVDCPIMHEEDLFDGRRKQLDSLIRELNQFSGEPFAVVISGEWGSGKTSLVNILRNKMEDGEKAEFVEVECGVEYDVKGILNDLAAQIQDVFEKNQFYTGRNSKVGQYFAKIGELVDTVGYSTISKVINRIREGENTTYLERKKRINQELNAFYKLTGKRIFIIVDNMDRIVDDKMRAIIFTIIRESVTLNNCCTLFMADYGKLISDYLSGEFLEKYVNRHIEISRISFEEIIEHYLNNYLTQEFWIDKSVYIREKEAEAKHKIVTKAGDVLFNIEKQIKSINESVQKENKENNRIEELNRQVKILRDAELRLQTRTTNPRKVKRFLDSIERNITIADILWFQKENSDRDRNEYSQENWVDIICQVAFLQAFFAEEYDAVLSAKSLVNFQKDHDHSIIVENVIDGFSRYFIRNKKKEEIAEKIIYQLYALNIETDKTAHQQLLEEIDQGRLKEEHLPEYINECLGRDLDFTRMGKILDYLEHNQNGYSRNLSEAVLKVAEFISHNRNFEKEGYIGILERVKKLIDIYIFQEAFDSQQVNLLERYIQILQTSVIFQNFSNMTYILNVVFDKRFTLEDNMNIDSIDKLYRFIVNENPLEGVIITEHKLDSLHKYIYTLKDIIQREKYSYAKESLQYFMDKVLNMLKILEIWFGKEDSSESTKIILRSVKFNSEILENSDELLHALSIFKESIKKYADNRNNGETFIRLAFDIENTLSRIPNCYGRNEKKVVQELCSIYELLQKDNQKMKQYFGELWIYVPIRLLLLRQRAGISNK